MDLDRYRGFSVQAQKSFSQLDPFRKEIESFTLQSQAVMEPDIKEKIDSILIPVQNFLRIIEEGKLTVQDLNQVLDKIERDGQSQELTDSVSHLGGILISQKRSIKSEIEKIKSALENSEMVLP